MHFYRKNYNNFETQCKNFNFTISVQRVRSKNLITIFIKRKICEHRDDKSLTINLLICLI